MPNSPSKRSVKRATTLQARRAALRGAIAHNAPTLADTLAGFLHEAGMSRADIAREFRAAADRASAKSPRLLPNAEHATLRVAGALRQWWYDPDYLDDDGFPKPLPLVGTGLSVTSLIDKHVSSEVRDEALAILRQSVSVGRDGRWRPHSSRRFLRAFGDDATKRLQVSLAGILRTFLHNQVSVRAPGQKNFDRTATVLQFPDALLPELRQTLHRRLMVALEDVDRIISESNPYPPRGRVSQVGVSMFLYDFSEAHPSKLRQSSRKR
jgi:hypothetical protein